jgi:hypothetical protein
LAPSNSEDNDKFTRPNQQVVGCLMYAMVLTRYDINYAVTKCAQYSKAPRQSHWIVVKRIMQYLRGTIDFGIQFSGTVQDLITTGYIDEDYNMDQTYHKFHIGLVFKMANGPISWASQH